MTDSASSFSAGIYAGQHFLVQELNEAGLALTLGKGFPAYFSVGYRYKGYALFRRSELCLSFGRSFGKNFAAGLRAARRHLSEGENYGSRSDYLVTAAARVTMSAVMDAAVMFGIPLLPAAEREERPFAIGLRFRFSPLFSMTAESHMRNSRPDLRLSIRYRPHARFALTAGMGGRPLSTAFGFSLFTGSFTLSAAAAYRPVLGFTPGTGIAWQGDGK